MMNSLHDYVRCLLERPDADLVFMPILSIIDSPQSIEDLKSQ